MDTPQPLSAEDVPRREFLSQATLTAVAAVLAACSGGGDGVLAPAGPNAEPTPGSSGTSLIVTVASFAALANVGGIAAVGTLGTKPVAVVRTGASSYLALSRICTHAACDVDISGGAFSCPCHGSRFDSQGAVTRGPATAALQRFNVSVSSSGATLTIS